MNIPKYPTCFVCGSENERGLNLTFESNGDSIEAAFEPDTSMCSYTGVVHGGIIASVLDEGMGWTGYPSTKKFFFTAEMKVRYKKSIIANRKYILKAKLINMHKRIYVAQGQIVDNDGTVYATAEGKYILLKELNKKLIGEGSR
jgi:uncharacterized protein (TIGR00369 family)